MFKKNKFVSITWDDAKLYSFNLKTKEHLTRTKCQGESIKENKDFIILKNCQQFICDKKQKKFFLKRKSNFFYIPKGMIKNIKIIKT
jgi:hypothetical protein